MGFQLSCTCEARCRATMYAVECSSDCHWHDSPSRGEQVHALLCAQPRPVRAQMGWCQGAAMCALPTRYYVARAHDSVTTYLH